MGYFRHQINTLSLECWKQQKWATVRIWATLTGSIYPKCSCCLIPQSNCRSQLKKVNAGSDSKNTVHLCICVSYLGKRWHHDALWEGHKPAEAVWCFALCSAWKPWVPPFMWTLLWHEPATQTLLQTKNTLSWKQFSLMAVASFRRIMCPSTLRKSGMFRHGLRNTSSSSWLDLQTPETFKSNQAAVESMEAPLHKLQAGGYDVMAGRWTVHMQNTHFHKHSHVYVPALIHINTHSAVPTVASEMVWFASSGINWFTDRTQVDPGF